jgi:hypothetical protein
MISYGQRLLTQHTAPTGESNAPPGAIRREITHILSAVKEGP